MSWLRSRMRLRRWLGWRLLRILGLLPLVLSKIIRLA
jgi:hypothetical protein